MNGPQALTYLADVKPYKSSWRVQVKVLHLWKQYTSQSGETMEFVLADERGTKIHASIKKSLVNKFERYIRKDVWTVIENFYLNQVRGQFRVTNHAFKMAFLNNTIVTPCNAISESVYLSLAEFHNIIVGDLNPFFLVDVLGQIIKVGKIETIEANNKPTKKLEFEIRNTRNERLPCTMWGKFAEKVFKGCENGGEQSVICLIRFAKINTFRGENQITNAFDASDIIINPVYPEAIDFAASLPTDGLTLTICESTPRLELIVHNDEYFNQYPRKTIQALLDSTEVEKCKIMCTIFAIDTDMGWFYVGCKKCSKKVESIQKQDAAFLCKPKKQTFWCPKCNLNITAVVPRFKLHVRVMDGTGETRCMLFDGAATEFVGQSANDLLDGVYDDELNVPDRLPLAIKNLVGKTFLLLVCVENDNLSGGNDTYRVGKIWSGSEEVKIDELDDSEGVTNPSQILSGGQEMYMLTNSTDEGEGSMCDLATPSSKRSNELDVDAFSTKKKKQMKAIKLEKFDEIRKIKVESFEEKQSVSVTPNEVETSETPVSDYADN